MTINEQRPITNGPSKWDLSVALFDRKLVNGRKVRFAVATTPEVQVEVLVSSVQAEDGSGESWNIEGYATELKCFPKGGTWKDTTVPPPPHRVFICFRTDRRTGYIKFLD